jgi:hypothetical protein
VEHLIMITQPHILSWENPFGGSDWPAWIKWPGRWRSGESRIYKHSLSGVGWGRRVGLAEQSSGRSVILI